MDVRIQREPALFLIGLVPPLVAAVAAYLFETNPTTQGVINAAAVAVAGAITAVLVRSDNLVPIITGAVQALLALGVAFGLHATAEQQALILAPVALVAGYLVRQNVTAPVPEVVAPAPGEPNPNDPLADPDTTYCERDDR